MLGLQGPTVGTILHCVLETEHEHDCFFLPFLVSKNKKSNGEAVGEDE